MIKYQLDYPNLSNHELQIHSNIRVTKDSWGIFIAQEYLIIHRHFLKNIEGLQFLGSLFFIVIHFECLENTC